MKRFVLRYGLISGAMMIAIGLINWFLLAKTIGYTGSEIMGYASMIVGLMFVPLAIRYYRDQLNQGSVSLGEGMKIGVGVSFIASVIMFFYTYLFFFFQRDEFMEWYKVSMTAEEWSAAEAQMSAMPAYVQTPWFNGLLLFFTVFVIGVIMTLISSLIMKSSAQTVNG